MKTSLDILELPVLEKHGMEFTTTQENFVKWKIIPKDTNKLLEEVFSSKDKIDDILTTHFSKELGN